MAGKAPLNIVLGTANVGDKTKDPLVRWDKPEEVLAYLNAYYARGGRQIDTARSYSPHAPGSSEPRLGLAQAGTRFLVDTKIFSLTPHSHAKDKIEENVNTSIHDLNAQINIEYLHQPDRATPFEETLEAIDKAYKEGKFKHFGLSNYTAEEVEQIIEIAERRGFVKPTVYQGQYNPIVRGGEKELFPLLRKHNISFYAWSPTAAGFFAGNYKNIKPGDRYDKSTFIGNLYQNGYMKPEIEQATDKAVALAAKHGINGHAVALRWTIYHSQLSSEFDDAAIISASSIAQLSDDFDMIAQGPLPEPVVEALNAVFAEVADSAMPYHF